MIRKVDGSEYNPELYPEPAQAGDLYPNPAPEHQGHYPADFGHRLGSVFEVT